MKQYFYGENRNGPYFEGWYFKCQTKEGEIIAFIPAMHIRKDGQRSASLQVITADHSWFLEYPISSFSSAIDVLDIVIAGNSFSEAGMRIDIQEDGLIIKGDVIFGAFDCTKSNIMGPLAMLSNAECSHSIFSLSHPLEGSMQIGNRVYDFQGGVGYIEGDRGRSFPASYFWTQCLWDDCSLMLSVATISLFRVRFTGCICAIKFQGREYRLASYWGAKIIHWSKDRAIVAQGEYQLDVRLLQENPCILRAPHLGDMGRKIHESISSTVNYRFLYNGKLLLDRTVDHASYEYDSSDKQEMP